MDDCRDCGIKVYGGITNSSPCPKCKCTERSDRRELDDHEHLGPVNRYCKDCKSVLDRGGYMLIEVKDGESGENPFRTGRICGVTEEGMRRFVDPSKWDQIKNNHISFMDQTTFKAAGLDKILKEQKELAKK